MVSEEEMKILIEIQLLTLIACGVRITQLKFAGDKVGTAMGMTENIVIGGLNSWKISSLVSSHLPKDCECYLVKHTARYFHQFAMLDKVVLGNIDLSALCSTSEKTGKATQICPDQKFMEAMSIFVYEEVYLLNRFYEPSGVDFLENLFNSIKSTAPLHLLLAGVSSFYEFSNMVMIKYGSFNARRDVNAKSVKRVLNPIINRDIVPKTKKVMNSAAAAVLNDLMPQPRVLDNQRVRAKNHKLQCIIEEDTDEDDFYHKFLTRQDQVHQVATGFTKLYQRLQKNGRTMLSGKSGHFINQLFAARLFDQDEKFVIAFHDPNKQIKLTTNKYSFKLSNIYVAAAHLEIIDGVVKSYLPLATVVGPGKTTSLSPMIAKIVKAYLQIFGDNVVVLFDFKRQNIGFVRESKSVLKNLAGKCSLVPSSFVMDQWKEYDVFQKSKKLLKTSISGTSSELFFNGSKSNFGKLSVSYLGHPIPCVDDAYCYHSTKRFKKCHTKKSERKGVSIVGVLKRVEDKVYLEADDGHRLVRFVLSDFGQLTKATFVDLNIVSDVSDKDGDGSQVSQEEVDSSQEYEEEDDCCLALLSENDNEDKYRVFTKVVRRKKKKMKIYNLVLTNDKLHIENFKYQKPNQQPKSNSFVYVNTNPFSVLDDNVSNSDSDSFEDDSSGPGSDSGSDSHSGSGLVNDSGSDSVS
jgi:hypothetical protein